MASYSDIDYGFLGVGEDLTGATPVRVANLSPHVVEYVLTDPAVRRTFTPATPTQVDLKTIQFHELYTLYNSPGGPRLVYDHLQIQDNRIREALGLPTDPEFGFSYNDIKKLVQEGTEEEILDAIEFGPYYIPQWMKNIIVTEGLNDYSKRKFFGTLFSMDLNSAQDNFEWAKGDPITGEKYKAMDSVKQPGARQRRTGNNGETTAEPAGRQRRAPKK